MSAMLVLIYVAIFFGWMWPWGALFLWSTVAGIRAGYTELIDPIYNAENPVVFWMVSATWVLVSIALIAWDIAVWVSPESVQAFAATAP
jgi:hypothetical protein